MKTPIVWLASLGLALGLHATCAADSPALLEDETFQDQLRGLNSERSGSERLRHAHRMISSHRLSSLQVKTVCVRLPDDAARLEFATSAYPRTVDPENFYEVYDAFTSFSKVLRLHDRVRGVPSHWPAPIPAPVPLPMVMSDEDIKPIVQALRKENFDNVRTQLARQIITSSRKQFLSDHIRQMMECFDFEPPRLELAKFAYDYTFDREKYFLVNAAFDFDNSKDNLARYIQSKPSPPPPGRR